jgi:DUF971 family protein
MGIDLEATEVRLTSERSSLEVIWNTGGFSRFGADQLRAACRCAECTHARRGGVFASAIGLVISRVDLLGSYALNLQFSDGHARGIYPWAFLYELCEPAEQRTAFEDTHK